jgi:formylglycine-generating enzyme required for sulfatase activity
MDGIKMTLKYVQAGEFMMGSPTSEKDHYGNETQHHVTLTKDYWLGETEVTQEQYKAVMGRNPSSFSKGGAYPVEDVSWTDAMAFCEKLTKAERTNGNLPDGYEYTLPTEAQWEYAARGGHKASRYHVYSGSDEIHNVAWYDDNSSSSTHPVGQKRANELGLYDMSGNVWEWCRDRYDGYPSGSVTDTVGPSSGSFRVLRGGSWSGGAGLCRSANRNDYDPSNRGDGVGFRVALASVQ